MLFTGWATTILLGVVLYLGFKKIKTELRSFKDHYSITEQLEYKIDYLLSLHPEYKTYALCYICVLLIVVGGLFYFFTTAFCYVVGSCEEAFSFPGSLKKSWLFLLDNGAHLDEEGLFPALVAFVLSIGGMLVDALLVGLVADALGDRMDSLKQGKSKVLEEDHSLILGWNDKVLPLIRELAEANSSEGGGVVVVMDEREKGEMEDEIANYFPNDQELKGTVVVCRSGNPMLVSDLEKVSADHARAIAVMAHEGDPDESDSKAVRIVLALCGGLKVKGHVVTELRDIDNKELVQLVSEQKVEVMVSHDIVGRLMIQCARQRGLANTYTSLLGFDDDEFYLQNWPAATGKTFDEVALLFEDAIAAGVKQAQPVDADWPILLNPPRDYVIQEGDEILVIAEDDDTYTLASAPNAAAQKDAGSCPDWTPAPAAVEKILFCGWRRDLDDMIVELDKCVTSGSELHVLSTIPLDERGALLEEGGMSHLDNLNIVHHVGNMVLRRRLEELPLETYDSIMILAEHDADATYADSRSLSSLLLIRDIQQKRSDKHCTVISEIMDPRTKQLVSVARISDYVVSNELVSMSLAMVLEQREINLVLTELFTAEGSEIFMRDVRYFCQPGEKLNFWQIMRRAGQRREVVLGYKRGQSDVVLNPSNKNEEIVWTEDDTIVVLAVD